MQNGSLGCSLFLPGCFLSRRVNSEIDYEYFFPLNSVVFILIHLFLLFEGLNYITSYALCKAD